MLEIIDLQSVVNHFMITRCIIINVDRRVDLFGLEYTILLSCSIGPKNVVHELCICMREYFLLSNGFLSILDILIFLSTSFVSLLNVRGNSSVLSFLFSSSSMYTCGGFVKFTPLDLTS